MSDDDRLEDGVDILHVFAAPEGTRLFQAYMEDGKEHVDETPCSLLALVRYRDKDKATTDLPPYGHRVVGLVTDGLGGYEPQYRNYSIALPETDDDEARRYALWALKASLK